MKPGRVKQINQRNGMFIVESPPGFVVFELLELADIRLGDVIVADWYALGRTEIQVRRTGVTVRVFGQSGPSPLAACQRIVG